MYFKIALITLLNVSCVFASNDLIDEVFKKVSKNLFIPLCKYDVFDNKNLTVHNSFSLYKVITSEDALNQNSIDKILSSKTTLPPKRKIKEFDQINDIIKYED